jgi:Ca2+-binding EF-hand superfamily protein
MYRAVPLIAVLCFVGPATYAGDKPAPKIPYRIVPSDILEVRVTRTLPDAPIMGLFAVEPTGRINLRFSYGSVPVAGLTVEEAKAAVQKHLSKNLLPGYEVTVVVSQARGGQPKDANAAAVDKIVNNLLAQFDADKDGKISKKEAKAKLLLIFDKFDANKDGFLDRKELRQVAMFILGQQGGKGPGLDFDALDRNADGRLTRDEVRGTVLEKLFDQIDTNRDGRISREEFEAFLEKTRPKQP